MNTKSTIKSTLVAGESFVGPDKVKPLVLSTVIGFGSTVLFEDKTKGFAACAVIGAAKEGLDAMGYGTASVKDFVADAVGCAIGAYTGGLVVTYKGSTKSVGISYSTSF